MSVNKLDLTALGLTKKKDGSRKTSEVEAPIDTEEDDFDIAAISMVHQAK